MRVVFFFVFFLAYIGLFIGVPPTPLCALGACGLSPRPEAFLLAASIAFGMPAILGVSVGVFSAATIYEWIHPIGTTTADALVALVVFLTSCLAAHRLFQRGPSIERALLSTWVITALVTLLLGTYALLVGGNSPEVYLSILSEAVIPINIAGVIFLSWPRVQRRFPESEGLA